MPHGIFSPFPSQLELHGFPFLIQAFGRPFEIQTHHALYFETLLGRRETPLIFRFHITP